jgi:hypothetical protein
MPFYVTGVSRDVWRKCLERRQRPPKNSRISGPLSCPSACEAYIQMVLKQNPPPFENLATEWSA